MPFIIMFKNVKIGILYGDENFVKYKILFENLPNAAAIGFQNKSILNLNPYGELPSWIEARIPQEEENKFDYLRKTQGRLTSDQIWFATI